MHGIWHVTGCVTGPGNDAIATYIQYHYYGISSTAYDDGKSHECSHRTFYAMKYQKLEFISQVFVREQWG